MNCSFVAVYPYCVCAACGCCQSLYPTSSLVWLVEHSTSLAGGASHWRRGPGSVNSPIKRTGDWRSPGKTQVRPRSVIGTAVPVPGHATASRRPPVREFTGRGTIPAVKQGETCYNRGGWAPVAQWTEQEPSKFEVVGSSPAGRAGTAWYPARSSGRSALLCALDVGRDMAAMV